MVGRVLSRKTCIRPVGLYSHQGDFWLIDFECNREVATDAFELFGRLNVPAGDYEFDRVRAEVSTGMQRAVNVVLSVP